MMPLTVSIDARLDDLLREGLLASSPDESGAFCLLWRAERPNAARLILGAPLALREDGFVERGEAVITPSTEAISAAVGHASSAGAALAFIHTHPLSKRAPVLSNIDWRTTERLGRVIFDLTGEPFLALVLSPGGWAGAIVEGQAPVAVERILVSGRRFSVFVTHRVRSDAALDDRQQRAIGAEQNARLRALHVGIVGAGGLGSPAAETLVRMGVGRVTLVDHDLLDTPSNARRVFGVASSDFQIAPPPAKVEVVARHLRHLDLGPEIDAIVGDIRDASVQGRLMECDLILNGTDTHSSRAAVSQLALQTLIPLIDIGVRVGQRVDGSLDSLVLERRVQLPQGPCLWCWGVLSAEEIRVELLPPDERDKLIREGYVTGDPGAPAPSVAALTVSAAGLAASAVVGLVGGAFDVAPLRVRLDAVSLDAFPLGSDEPDPDCVCRLWRREVRPIERKQE